MARLIDADALIKEWENTFDSELGSKGYMLFIGAVNNMSTVTERKEILLDDGTLMLECNSDLSKVTRVNIRQRGTHNEDLFYREEDLIWMG